MCELTKNVKTRDGRDVVVEISDFGDVIWVKTPDGSEIGHAELSLIEDDDRHYYRLTWMYLDRLDASYTQQGLGREALVFHKECFGLPIEVADDDGQQRADGSHLTGDAPGFAAQMVKEGILFRDSGPHDTATNDDTEAE